MVAKLDFTAAKKLYAKLTAALAEQTAASGQARDFFQDHATTELRKKLEELEQTFPELRQVSPALVTLHSRLVSKYQQCKEAYYVGDRALISDAEYDHLEDQIKRLEEDYPALSQQGSKVRLVGAKTSSNYTKVTHDVPMLSLGKANHHQEIAAFVKRLKKETGSKTFPPLLIEHKIDGVSASLRYRQGNLVIGATRGDGQTGEDVTRNILFIRQILQQLPLPLDLEVRGEIYMTKASFIKLEATRKTSSGGSYRTPRNSSSGLLRRKELDLEGLELLNFYAYDVLSKGKKVFATDEQQLAYLADLGFPVIPHHLCTALSELEDYYQQINSARADLPYDIDGLVCKLNDLEQRQLLSADAHSPNWALAYKFPSGVATTKVEEIVVQVGRLGTLTPVAVVKPVNVGGVFITRASLYNESSVKKLDLRLGDEVEIVRAGDVIPKITKTLVAARQPNSQPWEMPHECPVCGAPTLVSVGKDGATTRSCEAVFSCPAQKIERLKHFVSRKAFDLRGLGPELLTKLEAGQWISGPASIFSLRERTDQGKKLYLGEEKLENLGEVSVTNLLTEIESHRRIGLQKFIYALSIPMIGAEEAKKIATTYRSLDKWLAAMRELVNHPATLELISLVPEGMTQQLGTARTKALQAYYSNPDNFRAAEQLIKAKPETTIIALLQLIASRPKITSDYATSLATKYQTSSNWLAVMKQLTSDQTTLELLEKVTSLGINRVTAIREYFALPVNFQAVEDLIDQVTVLDYHPRVKSTRWAGQNIVVTGKDEQHTRHELQLKIEAAGAKFATEVTPKTDLLVYGDRAGSKLRKAEQLKIQVIPIADFIKTLQE